MPGFILRLLFIALCSFDCKPGTADTSSTAGSSGGSDARLPLGGGHQISETVAGKLFC